LLPALARAYDVQFISDAYWSSPRFPGASLGGATSIALFELLDRFATPSHGWDRRGNLVRLRSRTWYLDRPREIPLRLVRRWKDLCSRHGALPAREWLESVAVLSDDQLESLGRFAREVGLPPEFYHVHTVRHGLRLYASLTPAQREALEKGQAIPTSGLLPRQRELFLTVLVERSRFQYAPLSLPGGASISMTGGRLIRVVEHGPDGTVTYRSELVASSNEAPAVGTRRDTQRANAGERHPITQMTLYLQYSPQSPGKQQIAFTLPPSPLADGASAIESKQRNEAHQPRSFNTGWQAVRANLWSKASLTRVFDMERRETSVVHAHYGIVSQTVASQPGR
jgi:hypothetical protein